MQAKTVTEEEQAMFKLFAPSALCTGRDEWVYDFEVD